METYNFGKNMLNNFLLFNIPLRTTNFKENIIMQI
ncbi:hypothetical protein SAMN06265218_11925 [Fodinibius sediminis]|uniref:Uncharacterized protein n=1 Tax=Fodinibius sediminis TaxID=1214077 RepID=A0A521EUR9_9BACT|nr:hypothetical protein SAMN06265218_11925 [Fodinibius sediminis]